MTEAYVLVVYKIARNNMSTCNKMVYAYCFVTERTKFPLGKQQINSKKFKTNIDSQCILITKCSSGDQQNINMSKQQQQQ